MRIVKPSIAAAGLFGGALVLSGAGPATAGSLTPALAQTGDMAAVLQITHDPLARPGRYYGQSYGQRRNYSRYRGPAVGFGLSVPGFSFGVGVPRAYGSYGYGYPYGYGSPSYGWPGPYGNSVGYRGY